MSFSSRPPPRPLSKCAIETINQFRAPSSSSRSAADGPRSAAGGAVAAKKLSAIGGRTYTGQFSGTLPMAFATCTRFEQQTGTLTHCDASVKKEAGDDLSIIARSRFGIS
jgi:hypothetical protein